MGPEGSQNGNDYGIWNSSKVPWIDLHATDEPYAKLSPLYDP